MSGSASPGSVSAANSTAANNHLSASVSYRKQRKRMLEGGAEVYEMRPDAKTERAHPSIRGVLQGGGV